MTSDSSLIFMSSLDLHLLCNGMMYEFKVADYCFADYTAEFFS